MAKKLILLCLLLFLPINLYPLMLEGSFEGGYVDRYEAYFSRVNLALSQSLDNWVGPFIGSIFFQYDIFATRDSETRTIPSTYSYGMVFSFYGFYFKIQHFEQPIICTEVTRQVYAMGREMNQIVLGAKFKIGKE